MPGRKHAKDHSHNDLVGDKIYHRESFYSHTNTQITHILKPGVSVCILGEEKI